MAKTKTKKKRHPSFVPCRDYIFAMLPLVGMAVYLYGIRVLLLVAVSLLTAFLCDLAASLMKRQRLDMSDLSSYMFAMIFTIMLPATIGYPIVAMGTAVTVLIAKHAFGGFGNYIFHPSAFGFAFTSLCIGDKMYQYPKPFAAIGLVTAQDTVLYSGVANALKLGGVPNVDTTNLFLGKYPGPLGTTFCLIILACLLLLVARGTVSWQIPTAYLATCALWAYLFPRIQTTRMESVMYEMLSGAVVFAAAFIITSPTISPKNKAARILYGITMGIGCMFYRYVGVYEMGICFAALLINPFATYFDRIFAPKSARVRVSGRRKK